MGESAYGLEYKETVNFVRCGKCAVIIKENLNFWKCMPVGLAIEIADCKLLEVGFRSVLTLQCQVNKVFNKHLLKE